MSDVLELAPEQIAESPGFVSRLRPGRFTSPSGVESFFLFDDLSRTRAKRGAAHDVVDADTTVLQDLGSSLQVFTMSVYFTGENCDQFADLFYNSLFERYTPDSPGILNHPRWGDVPVIPFGDPEQSESFTSGAGISRVNVVFRETASLSSPQTSALSTATVAANTKAVNASALERASKMVTNTKASYAKFKNSITKKIKTVTDAIDDVSDLVSDIGDEVESITQDIYAALDEAATPVIIMAQLSELVQTVASVPQTVTGIVNAYVSMADNILNGYDNDMSNATTNEDRQNLALSLQAVGSIVAASTAIATLNVDYETRDQVGDSIDSLSDLMASYQASIDNAVAVNGTSASKSFSPDGDVASGLHGIIFDAQSLLINKAYALKSRRTYRLTAPSDPMTLTWTYYGNLDMLDFFCRTNKVTNNEFIELPAGRNVVVYV